MHFIYTSWYNEYSMAKNTQLLVDIGQGLSLMIGLPRIATWETGNRPQKPRQGTIGFNSKTKSLEFYDGNYWFEANMNEG